MSYQKHICDASLNNDGSFTMGLNKGDKFWRLYICKLATEEDLEENHHLEVIDQTIWQTQIEILHCPFCGDHLVPAENASIRDFGDFQHNDFSKWN